MAVKTHKGLTHLQLLNLANTNVTDKGLEALVGMTELQRLSLSGTKVTGAGARHLKGLTRLEQLNLSNTNVTDLGLEHLKGMTNLERLNLSRTKVTDAGIGHLKGMAKLQVLRLRGTRVTDAGLKQLDGLTRLEVLDLTNSNVTDAGLQNLSGLLGLKVLNVGGTKMLLSEAVGRMPNSPIDLGCQTLERDDRDKALARLNKAIEAGSRDAAVYAARAYIYCKHRDNYDQAIADYSEAIRLAPAYGDAYCGRGAAYEMEGQTEKAIADVTEALRLNPKSFDALTTRGWIYEASDAWDEAIADFDAAIEVNDKCVSCYEARAVARIRRRDYAGGVADLETALRLNPKDQAAKFEAWSKMPVDSAAVRRGEAQVRQMVHDRPAMAQYGKKAAALYEWAARKFAGEDLGDEITWDASDPNPPFEAQNFGPGGVMRGFIRVRKLGLRPFEKMWCNAVFELYNIANTDRFQQIDGEVIAGTLGREQYVTKMIETESRTAEKTRSFYIHVFLPWAKENHVATDPREWYVASRFNPEENLLLPRAIRERGAYWEFYGRWWDEVSCGRNAGLLQNSCWAALTNSDGSRQFLSGAAVNQVFATDATAGSSSGGICWSLGNNGGVVCDLAANPADVTTEQDRSVHDSFGRVVDQSTSANDPTFTYTGRQCDADA